jgi:membrane-associated phospholipid phosphatase
MKDHPLWARLVSAIFHPLLMPSIAVAILFALSTYISFSLSTQAKRVIILIVFFNTAIAPMFVILFFKRIGYIKDVLLNERVDRIYPTLITLFLYMFTAYLFRQANMPSLLTFFIIGGTVLTFLGLIVTLYWKISIHMMSMGGFTGFLICISLILKYDIPFLIVLSILISGLLGSSRIILNAHTPAQVYAGFVAGVSVMLSLFLYMT